MRKRIEFIIAIIGILIIIAIVLYWSFCIHWTIGVLGIGYLIFITALINSNK